MGSTITDSFTYMIGNTKIVYFAVISIGILVLIKQQLTFRNTDYHSFLGTKEYVNAPRTQQILKCASCHKQEYENELLGPHSNAYRKLEEHLDFINSTEYDCPAYTQYVNTGVVNCANCHAPENLLETILKDTSRIKNLLSKQEFLKSIAGQPPTARSVNLYRETGIDCISCHYDGKQFVSLKHAFQPGDTISSEQNLNKIVKNLNCYPCHHDEVDGLDINITIARTGSVLCVNCHQEYGQQKKGTHYFYWRYSEKKRSRYYFQSLADDFKITPSPNKREVLVSWKNTVMPHGSGACPEMIWQINIMDSDSAVIGKSEFRFNMKAKHANDMLAFKPTRENPLPGIEGYDISADTLIQKNIILKQNKLASLYKLTYINKAQYWAPDSLGEIVYSKVYKIE